ncbi:MAG: ArsA family ATPase [Bdellovibrionia bacterium]
MASTPAHATTTIHSIVRRNLVFVHGKGGVGKSSVSEAIAWALAEDGARTLLVEFEDPTREPGELKSLGPKIWHLNADASIAFEEYSELKIDKLSHGILSGLGGLGSFGQKSMTKLFTQNKLIKYLAKAAPGIHELVLLGKVWHERNNYDHVIVDLPSTGYGLAMFQSTANFAKLFGGGPISYDAEAMLATFRDSSQTGNLIIALPEEMPLREAIDLNGYLKDLFPSNPAAFLVNRRFPDGKIQAAANNDSLSDTPNEWSSPYASSAIDYIDRRRKLESHNLKLWSQSGITYGELDYLPPDHLKHHKGHKAEQLGLTRRLSQQMHQRGYV